MRQSMRDLVRTAVAADCLLDPAAVRGYSIHGQEPAVVVAPRSGEEAAAVMQLAAREGLAVDCAGAGTRLGTGNPAQRVDVVMTTSAMTAVTEYEPADLVVSAMSGTTIAQLNDLVAPHNQFVALDAAVSPRSTLGSVVATGAAGPLRFAHGTPRDQVLGLEMVAGDGRILHFGGRVVKNVAGYDVVRLVVGSRGTLGLITKLSMRLKPLPKVDRTAIVKADSFAAIADVAETLTTTPFDPAAIEIVSSPLAHKLFGHEGWSLLVRVHGNGEAVADAIERVRSAAGGAQVDVVDGAGCWQQLASVEAAASVNVRLANLRSVLRETTAAALQLIDVAELENAQLAIHAGDGIVRVLADNAGSRTADGLVDTRMQLETRGGTVIVERMPQAFTVGAYGISDNVNLMKSIKQVFDPAGILGVGRFVL
jgi:glycolate oxidase FAD binding subunit